MGDFHGFGLEDFVIPARVSDYVETFQLRSAFNPENQDETDAPEELNRQHAVDPNNFSPYPPKWDDLARLHWLTRAREAVAVTEFGAGYSTSVIAHALKMNQEDLGTWAHEHRRIENPFTVLSIDQSDYWLERSLERTSPELREFIRPHASDVMMGSFQERACTYFQELPNFVADLVFLDGPHQYGPKGSIRGFSTASLSLMPMAGDLLSVEHFFEPGAVILVDGRTANARFLQTNLQRSWQYCHFLSGDFHLFELREAPLGQINLLRTERLAPILD